MDPAVPAGVEQTVLHASDLGSEGPQTDPAALEETGDRVADAGLSLPVPDDTVHLGDETAERRFAIGALQGRLESGSRGHAMTPGGAPS